MECLICHNSIVINNFSMLFSLDEPKICSCCAALMIPKKVTTFPVQLYEDNEFMRELIHRLKQGDLILHDVILQRLKHVVLKFKAEIKEIVPLETEMNSPYPSVAILVERLGFQGTGKNNVTLTEFFIESEIRYHISIL